MSEIVSIKELDFKAGSRVLMRCDFNTPMDEFCNITDDRRISSAIPT
ncbi:MAG: phosphoglycerate kinase, partial [Campylobacter sp.]|nr:phosphoglycerate kinase [Campylobacter sp.]